MYEKYIRKWILGVILGNTIQIYQTMEAANTMLMIYVFLQETLCHCSSGLQWRSELQYLQLQELNGQRSKSASQVHSQHHN